VSWEAVRVLPVEVEMLPAGAAGDRAAMAGLAGLVNDVYAAAERGMWVDGAARSSAAEFAELTRAGQIAVARVGAEIAGCIRVQWLDGRVAEFGMLAAAPAHRGAGVGRELVRFAERHAVAAGRRVMQLELLVPRDWSHPSKERLDAWYTRMGYRVVRTESIGEAYPLLAPLLATPCRFVIYHKEIG
jgi:GNAT superfamily N-acetyltransferase